MARTLMDRRAEPMGGVTLAAITISTAYVLSRALGVLRQTAINGEFGAGPETDAFWAAFTVPDLFFNLLVGGALTSVFVPVYARLVTEGRNQDAWKLACTVFNVVAILLVVVALLILALAPRLAPLIAAGFPRETQALTAHLTRILAVQPLYLGLGVVAMAVLNSGKHFALPAYAPVVYNLGIIAGALLLAPRVGVEGLAMGVTLGALGYFLLQVPGLRRQGLPYRFTLDLAMPELAQVGRLLVPRTLGLASSQVGGLITMVSLASGLPSGSVTVVRAALQIVLLPVGVFGVAIATAVFPTLADQAAAGDGRQLGDTVAKTLRFMLFLGAPSTVALVLLRQPLAALLLQHGRFSAEDARVTALALGFYGLALFAHLWDELLPRVYYALHDTMTPLLVNLGIVCVNVGASAILRRWLGVGGLGLGLSLAATVEAAVFLWLLSRRVPTIAGRDFWRDLGKVAVASLAMVPPLIWYAQALQSFGPQSRLLPQLLAVAGGILLGGVTYFAAAMLLRCDDAATVLEYAASLRARFLPG